MYMKLVSPSLNLDLVVRVQSHLRLVKLLRELLVVHGLDYTGRAHSHLLVTQLELFALGSRIPTIGSKSPD